MDKKARKALAEEISISIAWVLKKADDRAAGKVQKHIYAAAKQIVKRFDRHLSASPLMEEAPEKKSAIKVVKKLARKKAAGNKSSARKAVRKKAARKVKS